MRTTCPAHLILLDRLLARCQLCPTPPKFYNHRHSTANTAELVKKLPDFMKPTGLSREFAHQSSPYISTLCLQDPLQQ